MRISPADLFRPAYGRFAGGALSHSTRGNGQYELKAAANLGVCKINIATDARLLWARVRREFFEDNPEKFDPVIPGKTYIQEFADFVVHNCEILGSGGWASKFTNR